MTREDGNRVAEGRRRRHRRVLVSPSADGYPLTTESLPSTLESGAETPIAKRQNLAAAVPAARFSSANMEALKSGKYADAKVIANGKTYNVHKVVVCTRSKWFRAAFDGGFTEGQTSVVEISAPDNVERVLEFLYSGAVDLSDTADADLMLMADELSVLGDFYLIDEMKTYANQILGQYLGKHLSAICQMGNLADLPPEYPAQRYHAVLMDGEPQTRRTPASLRGSQFRLFEEEGFVDRLCTAIRAAYAIPSGIDAVYVDFVYAARIHTFKNEKIRDLKEEIPKFGNDLLNAMMIGPRSSAFNGNKAFEQWKDGLVNPKEPLDMTGGFPPTVSQISRYMGDPGFGFVSQTGHTGLQDIVD
ncbi:hypothetical protein N8I77_002887 [Diaporthe amygdali]|uniref:BTB domain-containing protein n=1 Tax=Phomopsis amygdali TaxID=1214568 RepID=A0AAD9SGX4_PHOAM|nr:hypothetical protein N8I77_002887 [Diaporthe amygdali]